MHSRWTLVASVGLSGVLVVAAFRGSDGMDVSADRDCLASSAPSPSAAEGSSWARASDVSVFESTSRQWPGLPDLSVDGSRVAFSVIRSRNNHVYARLVEGCALEIASSDAAGEPADYANTLDMDDTSGEFELGSVAPSLSADGRQVRAGSVCDFLPPYRCGRVVLSGDASAVAFFSDADDLVPGDRNGARDAFVKDLTTGTVVRASEPATGGRESKHPDRVGSLSVSDSGDVVAFDSPAALVADDRNERSDVFVRDLRSGRLELVSRTSDGRPYTAPSRPIPYADRVFVPATHSPALSPDGTTVVFVAGGHFLRDTDLSEPTGEVVIRDLATGAMQSFEDSKGASFLTISATKDRIAYQTGDGEWAAIWVRTLRPT